MRPWPSEITEECELFLRFFPPEEEEEEEELLKRPKDDMDEEVVGCEV